MNDSLILFQKLIYTSFAYIRIYTYFFEIKFHDANNSNDVNHNTVNQKKKKKNQETTFIKYEYENISTERIV